LHVAHPPTLQFTTQVPDLSVYPVLHVVQALSLVQELQLLEHGEQPNAAFK